jgi:hypothetical protein
MLLIQVGKFNYTNYILKNPPTPLTKVPKTHVRHYTYKCNKNTIFGTFEKNI